MPRFCVFLLLAVALALGGAVRGETGPSGLPLPRFVSLGADEVNARAGPDFRFPIDWVFVRKNLPVEVVEEFGPWRRVRDYEGAGGWIHTSLLTGRRMALVTDQIRPLRAKPNTTARVIARAEPGAQGRLLKCDGPWCRIELGSLRGWLPRDHIWGVYPDEEVD